MNHAVIAIVIVSLLVAIIWRRYTANALIERLASELTPRYMTRVEYYQWIYKVNPVLKCAPYTLIVFGKEQVLINKLNELINNHHTPYLYDTIFSNLF